MRETLPLIDGVTVDLVHVVDADLEDAGGPGEGLGRGEQRAFDAVAALGGLFGGYLDERRPDFEVDVFSDAAWGGRTVQNGGAKGPDVEVDGLGCVADDEVRNDDSGLGDGAFNGHGG
jgi:hypothetical protein